MENTYDGNKLAKCFEVASSAWHEIDALTKLLNNQIEVTLTKCDIRFKKSKKPVYNSDDSNYMTADVAQSFGLFKHRGKKPSRYLSYQISVLGDGMAIAEEPLAHFFCWNDSLDFESGCYVEIPFEDEPTMVEGDRLVWWTKEEPHQWMFSVRLTAINSEEAVKNIAIAMVALLKEKPIEDSLPSNLPGLVLYSLEKGNLTVTPSK